MSIRTMVEAGRRLASTMLLDVGTITKGIAPPVFDPVTGELVASAGQIVYDGPCRVRMPNAIEANVIFGDTVVTVSRFIGLFPWDTGPVYVGNIVHVTESDDPHITSRTFRVVSVPSATVLMVRKYGLEVVE